MQNNKKWKALNIFVLIQKKTFTSTVDKLIGVLQQILNRHYVPSQINHLTGLREYQIEKKIVPLTFSTQNFKLFLNYYVFSEPCQHATFCKLHSSLLHCSLPPFILDFFTFCSFSLSFPEVRKVVAHAVVILDKFLSVEYFIDYDVILLSLININHGLVVEIVVNFRSAPVLGVPFNSERSNFES